MQSQPILHSVAGIPDHLQYALPCDGVVGPGTSEVVAPMTLHYGAGHAPPPWPDATAAEQAHRVAFASLLRGIDGLEDTTELIHRSPFPGRVIVFAMVVRPSASWARSVTPLSYKDNSNSFSGSQ